MQARRLRGPRAWDGRTKFDSPRQISRDERVDLTLATMELEGLELGWPSSITERARVEDSDQHMKHEP